MSVLSVLATPANSGPTSADLGVTASTYASFAEIMTGFSFAALAIYLAYEVSTGAHSSEAKDELIERAAGRKPRITKGEDGKQKNPLQVGGEYPIRRAEAAAALFYAMASLGISSFLYASLTAEVTDPYKVAGLLLLYGTVFGTSVLGFFYALTLITHENASTSAAARSAYWVVVIIGPAVVLRFLAGAAQSAWDARCASVCPPENWSPPLVTGMVILTALLSFSFVISKTRILERWQPMYGICNWLCVRPVLPTTALFLVAASVSVAAIFAAEPVSFVPSRAFVWLSLAGGAILLALFALACGCVIGPRLRTFSAPVQVPAETPVKPPPAP